MPNDAFHAHLAAVAAQSGRQGTAAAVSGLVARPWHRPAAYPIDGTDVQDPQFLITGCDRTDLNASCIEEYGFGTTYDSGRLGRVMAYKAAVDHQAAYERALHARYASAVRCRVWASARRAGHVDLQYGVFGAVGNALDSLMAAAGAVSNDPATGTDSTEG